MARLGCRFSCLLSISYFDCSLWKRVRIGLIRRSKGMSDIRPEFEDCSPVQPDEESSLLARPSTTSENSLSLVDFFERRFLTAVLMEVTISSILSAFETVCQAKNANRQANHIRHSHYSQCKRTTGHPPTQDLSSLEYLSQVS